MSNGEMAASTELTEPHSDKPSRLAPASMILPRTCSAVSIVVSTDMVPLVSIRRSLDCELPVAIIEVAALFQHHAANCIFASQVHLQPAVVDCTITSMPMPA